MNSVEKAESNEKDAESNKLKTCVVYLLISYPLEKGKTESDFTISFQEKEAKVIYSEKKEKENNEDYHIVIAYTLENPKKGKQQLEFKIDGEKKDFVINFEYKSGISFIYQLELFSVDLFYNSQKKIIQVMNYTQKFEVFLNSIKKLEQENLFNDLFNDTINIYSKNPKFDFAVNIFIKIYNKKNICPKLLEEFKKFNDKIKNNIKDKNFANINFEKYLKGYSTIFVKSLIILRV